MRNVIGADDNHVGPANGNLVLIHDFILFTIRHAYHERDSFPDRRQVISCHAGKLLHF
jgi:hypothetical protein